MMTTTPTSMLLRMTMTSSKTTTTTTNRPLVMSVLTPWIFIEGQGEALYNRAMTTTSNFDPRHILWEAFHSTSRRMHSCEHNP